jgi:alkylhydroperoxidase/carboxymuconolactone decarboxylase family protein YurZ
MLTREQIIERLEQIEQDLGEVGPALHNAGEAWTRAKRDKEKKWAEAYMKASGGKASTPVTDKKAAGILASEHIGVEAEARYVGLSKRADVLQTRAMIGMALLKSHDRVEAPVSPTGQTYGSRRAA